jgi:hypothetical protein
MRKPGTAWVFYEVSLPDPARWLMVAASLLGQPEEVFAVLAAWSTPRKTQQSNKSI